MSRTCLPDRRRSVTLELSGTPALTITIGYDGSGAVKEVFADGAKYGSDLAATMSDICTVISVSLQHGVLPCELAKSLGTVPAPMAVQGGAIPASPIGRIMDALLTEIKIVEDAQCAAA